VLRDKHDIVEVFFCQRRQPQGAVWQINALIAVQFFALHFRLRDTDEDAVVLYLVNESSNFAVIEPHAFACLNTIKDFWQRATDTRRRQYPTGTVSRRRMSRQKLTSQDQNVTYVEIYGAGRGLKVSNAGGFLSASFGVQPHQRNSGYEVCGPTKFCPAAARCLVDDNHFSPRATRVC